MALVNRRDKETGGGERCMVGGQKGGLNTGRGNSVILLLRTFKYRSCVHSEKRAGNVEILL